MLLVVSLGTGRQNEMNNNIIFRGVIVAMFTIILGLSAFIGSVFLDHLNSIDNHIADITFRVIKLEARIP